MTDGPFPFQRNLGNLFELDLVDLLELFDCLHHHIDELLTGPRWLIPKLNKLRREQTLSTHFSENTPHDRAREPAVYADDSTLR